MTREEAKVIFINRGFVEVDGGSIYDPDKWRESVKVISDWLEQQSCEDVISRQVTINDLQGRDPSQIWDTADVEVWVNSLPSVQPEQRWIPVSERLPEEYADVICCTDAKEVFIASYLGKLNDGLDCFDDNNGMMWEGEITAWMPLPEPYKEEV